MHNDRIKIDQMKSEITGSIIVLIELYLTWLVRIQSQDQCLTGIGCIDVQLAIDDFRMNG